MNAIKGYDDFYGLLNKLEGKPATWEKNNLFVALSYLNRGEIPAALSVLARRLQKNVNEISKEFQAYQAETVRKRANRRGGIR